MRHVPMRLRHLVILLLLAACARERPAYDVVLITLDTTRADHLGCYGGKFATPAVDAVAAAGVRFEQADAVAPLTLPSHATILSGRLPLHHGIRAVTSVMPADRRRDQSQAGQPRLRGTAFTRLSGSDLNGDIFRQDMVPDASNVNDARGDSYSQVDLRVSKEFRFAGNFGVELIGEIFNVFNSDNPQRYGLSGGTYVPTAYAGTDPTVAGEQRLAQLGARIRF